MDLGLSFLQPIAESDRIDQARAKEARTAAEAPADLAYKVGLGREANARASNLEASTEAEKRVAADFAASIAQGKGKGPGGSDAPPPLSTQLQMLGESWAKAGQMNKSEEALKAAEAALTHEATARAQAAKQASDKMLGAERQAKIVSQLSSDVTDEASWQASNQAYKQITGQDSPFAKMPYDPKLVKMIQDAGETMAEKARVAQGNVRLQLQQAGLKDKERHENVMESVAERRLSLSKERMERAGKVGGKDVGAPSSGEANAAKRMLQGEHGLVGEDDIDTAAYDVAAQARALRKQNPGLSADEAMRQTIQAKKESGDFTPPTPGKFFGLVGGAKGAYKPPVSLPSSGKKEDLVPGQHYKNAKGVVMEWDGKAFKPVGASKGPSNTAAPRSAASPEDDDELDDDGNG